MIDFRDPTDFINGESSPGKSQTQPGSAKSNTNGIPEPGQDQTADHESGAQMFEYQDYRAQEHIDDVPNGVETREQAANLLHRG